MDLAKHTSIYGSGEETPTYLDIQAAAGITKHTGGYAATDELHRLCRLETAWEVLEAGCGIGVGPAYIAQKFGCRVVAVDISEKMLSWAQRRARQEGVRERITFRAADVRELPFEDGRFDAVIAESVLVFVEDKDAAIGELIRVAKDGGYIGLNETFWSRPPPPDLLSGSLSITPPILTEAEWRALWEAVPLERKTVQSRRVSARQEVHDRIAWVGWRSILPAWGRVLKMLLTDPRSREAIRMQLDATAELTSRVGYGLFVGRKPLAGS